MLTIFHSISLMTIEQKSLCIFMHYSMYPYIPKYVSIYINELSRNFDQVIMVTNERSINTELLSFNQNVSIMFVKNEGYDLGMFYKVYQTINPDDFGQIACINDSNILFNELHPIFNWSKKTQYDFWGIIDSNEKPWFSTHQNNYHIQSHFIVFNQKAILKLPAFFDDLDIEHIFEEKDTSKLRKTVINSWEIGLSQFLISQGLTNGSYIDSQTYSLLYLSGKTANVGHKLFPELIRSGYPLIKKKIVTQSTWKGIFSRHKHWKRMIRKYGNQDWEIDDLIIEMVQIKSDYGNQSMNKLKKKLRYTYNLLMKKEVA